MLRGSGMGAQLVTGEMRSSLLPQVGGPGWEGPRAEELGLSFVQSMVGLWKELATQGAMEGWNITCGMSQRPRFFPGGDLKSVSLHFGLC